MCLGWAAPLFQCIPHPSVNFQGSGQVTFTFPSHPLAQASSRDLVGAAGHSDMRGCLTSGRLCLWGKWNRLGPSKSPGDGTHHLSLSRTVQQGRACSPECCVRRASP